MKDTIIIHCSASDVADHDDISVIDMWHKERGFSMVGYHYFIIKNGEVQVGRDVNKVGAHAKGHNKNSIGICLSGDKEFNDEQFAACASLIDDLMEDHPITTIIPHNFINFYKSCPNFNIVKNILTRIGR